MATCGIAMVHGPFAPGQPPWKQPGLSTSLLGLWGQPLTMRRGAGPPSLPQSHSQVWLLQFLLLSPLVAAGVRGWGGTGEALPIPVQKAHL